MASHNLFTSRFVAHKVVGLAYVLLFGRALYLCATHRLEAYETSSFWHYPLVLHCIGLLQTLTALYTFNFLARKTKVEGFFSDKTTVSKSFVKENAFFVLLCVFASAYIPPRSRAVLRKLRVVEPVMVFFPFQTVRRLFPKTSFNRDEGTKVTVRNSAFMNTSKYIASYFYLFGKHYVGAMLNYHLFLDKDTATMRGLMYWTQLGAGYALTIGIFLHTLKFRKILSPRLAIVTYLLGYLISGVPTVWIMTYATDLRLWALATGGLLVNIFCNKFAVLYQGFVFATLLRLREPPITLAALKIAGISQ
mmetsp:Transcript_13928/g.43974  ORF Transcript_13928/g.43974 Transcript_13928/m.43974 type:complete len:306 (+) Transcript_13928:117-1034(+)